MKVFEDKHEGIEYCLKTKDGQEHVIKMQPITIEDFDKMNKLTKKFQKDFDVKHMMEMLYIVFGEREEFWRQFSINLLTQLMTSIPDDLSKKNLKEQNG